MNRYIVDMRCEAAGEEPYVAHEEVEAKDIDTAMTLAEGRIDEEPWPHNEDPDITAMYVSIVKQGDDEEPEYKPILGNRAERRAGGKT